MWSKGGILVIFYHLLNITGINYRVIYKNILSTISQKLGIRLVKISMSGYSWKKCGIHICLQLQADMTCIQCFNIEIDGDITDFVL